MRHNELRDLEAELLNIFCSDVQVELALQDISGERLNGGSNRTPDATLDIRARGFWESQRSAFFGVRVCHLNAYSYKDLELRQVYKIHENKKPLCYWSPRNRARNIYTTRVHHNRRHRQRMCEIPYSIS